MVTIHYNDGNKEVLKQIGSVRGGDGFLEIPTVIDKKSTTILIPIDRILRVAITEDTND